MQHATVAFYAKIIKFNTKEYKASIKYIEHNVDQITSIKVPLQIEYMETIMWDSHIDWMSKFLCPKMADELNKW